MFRIKLKELREKKGLSQYKFADLMGFAQSTIGSWESGAREPNFETMQKIADYFNVSVDYLLGRTDTPNENKKSDEEPDVLMTEQFATFGDAREYSEDEKDEIRNFINFIKAKRRKEK